MSNLVTNFDRKLLQLSQQHVESDRAALIAKMNDRIANPPERYLTVDEFIAAVDADE